MSKRHYNKGANRPAHQGAMMIEGGPGRVTPRLSNTGMSVVKGCSANHLTISKMRNRKRIREMRAEEIKRENAAIQARLDSQPSGLGRGNP